MKTTIIEVPKRILSQRPIEQHPFLLSLPDLSNEQVAEAALQIYHVVLHFPRFLSALLTNMTDYNDRMPLVDNLYEEHGRLNAAYVHSQTYRQFLLGIGLTEQVITANRPIVPVIAYNRSMIDLCLHHPFTEGLAALGIIEEIVARVSPVIGRFATGRFTQHKESLFHFTSHETLDISHANEIYELAERHNTVENHDSLVRGFELGFYYHSKLYTDILQHVQELKGKSF